MTASVFSPGGQIERGPAYRAGYAFAETELAGASREVREAAARHMADERARLPLDGPEYQALSGGLAYLQHRHEGNGAA